MRGPKAASISLRPLGQKDARELCIITEHGALINIVINLSQIAMLGEQANRIVYAKLAGAKES
jgi:hypothetical protein